MTLNDRLTRGFIAGVLASQVQSGIMHAMYAVKVTKLRWLDFASVIVFGKRPKHSSQAFSSAIVTHFWSGLLGIGYAYALPRVGQRNRRFKGILYGMSSWFSIYAVVHLLNVGRLMKIDRNTAITHGLVATIWGLVLDESLYRLEQWTETPKSHSSSNLAAKRLTHTVRIQ